MRIVISNDHAATFLKDEMLTYLKEKNLNVTDLGSKGEKSADYPEYALAAAKGIVAGEYDFGILFCGTGAGMCMAANKVKGIRAVMCSEPYTARLAREHNNAQILCIGARVVGSELAKMIIDTFLSSEFEGGRHATRVNQFMTYEN
ncbi:MAG: ribose 5-phosphate isomerase B [Clostridiales bacterium]|jgi:ribose 5-phosphate isomerase B|nr:ribose 5-phosphate isomerase B [Clostridiales bacterium]